MAKKKRKSAKRVAAGKKAARTRKRNKALGHKSKKSHKIPSKRAQAAGRRAIRAALKKIDGTLHSEGLKVVGLSHLKVKRIRHGKTR